METSKLTFEHQLIMSLISIMIIMTGTISIISVILYKKKYIKEDLIILEKYSLQIICFMYFIIVSINDLAYLNELNTYFISNYVIIIYTIGKSYFNFFITIEGFKTAKNPFFILESYIYIKVKNLLYEFTITFIIIFFICFDIFYLNTKEIFIIDNIAFLLTNNLYIYIISLINLILSFILHVFKYFYLKNYFINSIKTLNKNKFEILSSFLDLIIISFSL